MSKAAKSLEDSIITYRANGHTRLLGQPKRRAWWRRLLAWVGRWLSL